MNALHTYLSEKILNDGPLSLQTYMETALDHPELGYYHQKQPFGKSGDFITAPEISQMFGELIGLWCVDCWMKLGSPANINLVELGPGTGTLMSDALRSAALAPDFLKAAHLHLVETSDRLKALQRQNLPGSAVNWHRQLPDLDDGPCLFIANEFFDALPIRQFENRGGLWHEKMVSLQNGQFVSVPSSLPSDINQFDLPNAATGSEGDIVEVSPKSREITAQIAIALQAMGGAALFIDYGPMESAFGDSFQAVGSHRFVDPFKNPGEVDLTAHVDFECLSRIATNNKCSALPIATQGRFLERLGIEARALSLSKNARSDQKEKIAQDLRRLVSAAEMGTLFKAFCFYATMTGPPSGFGE